MTEDELPRMVTVRSCGDCGDELRPLDEPGSLACPRCRAVWDGRDLADDAEACCIDTTGECS